MQPAVFIVCGLKSTFSDMRELELIQMHGCMVSLQSRVVIYKVLYQKVMASK